MKKRIFAILTLMALMSVGLVAAQSGDLPGAGWNTGQQVQNVGSSPASIVLTAYDQSGTDYNCGTNSNVAPGASVNYLTSNCPVPSGFVGSAVVSADQEIAAIVNVNNRPTGAAAGQYRGTSSPSTTVSFPLVKHNFGGRTTTFYVQNTGPTADITATFITGPLNGATTTRNHTYTNVPTNAMVIVSPADASVPGGDLGSLTVSSSSALAGSSLEHEHTATVGSNLQASTGFTSADADTTLYCPLYRKSHTANGFSTGVQVQNVSGSAQNITFEFTYSVGGGAVQNFSQTATNVANNASFTFFAGSIAGIPNGALGSAKITSGGDVVAVVNDRAFNLNPSRLSTYACFSDGDKTNQVVIPLFKEFFGGNTTGIQIVNVGASPATVNVTYAPVGGSPVTFTAPAIPAGQSATYFGVSSALSPAGINATSGTASSLAGKFGGVTITSNQPIFAIANESSFAGGGSGASGQDNKNYEGFNR